MPRSVFLSVWYDKAKPLNSLWSRWLERDKKKKMNLNVAALNAETSVNLCCSECAVASQHGSSKADTDTLAFVSPAVPPAYSICNGPVRRRAFQAVAGGNTQVDERWLRLSRGCHKAMRNQERVVCSETCGSVVTGPLLRRLGVKVSNFQQPLWREAEWGFRCLLSAA